MGDFIALMFSAVSVIIALISLYFSKFSSGKIILPSLRAYRAEPFNFHQESDSYRGFRIYLPLSFINTGARQHTINDMRLVINLSNDKLILSWENELMALHHEAREGEFATQPTLKGYESIARIYSFVTPYTPEGGKLVSEMEEHRETDPTYKATLELRNANQQWETLCDFNLKYVGINRFETNFELINK